MLRNFFYAFVICFTAFFVESEELERPKYDVAVSLGEVCQVATHLRDTKIRHQALPLDWTITSFDALCNFIQYEGENLLDKTHLYFYVFVPGTDGGRPIPLSVWDGFYNIYFVHDFRYSFIQGHSGAYLRFDQVDVHNYEEVKNKFDRRVARFFELLRSNKKILFMRLGITRDEAIQLDALLKSKYPHLDYLIVAIDGAEEAKVDWGLERVKNFYLHRSDRWTSQTADWLKILENFEFNINYAETSYDIAEE